jgi:hypothetical protein
MRLATFTISISAIIDTSAFTFQSGRPLWTPFTSSNSAPFKRRRYDTKTTFIATASQEDASSAAPPSPPIQKPSPLNNTMLNGEDVEEDATELIFMNGDQHENDESSGDGVTAWGDDYSEVEKSIKERVKAFLVSSLLMKL